MTKAYFQLSHGTVIETDEPDLWANDPQARRLSASTGKTLLVQEALTYLRECLPEGSTAWTLLRNVASSGMSRRISVFAIVAGEPRNLSMMAARVLGWPTDWDEGSVRVSGCGMDMGFHLVESLSRALYQKGDAIRQRWM